MPTIYVACLAAYNSGILHGEWIDLEGQTVEDIETEIARMLRASPCPNTTCECPECAGLTTEPPCPRCSGTGEVPTAEEWAVHDAEDIPECFGEHPDLQKLVDYAEAYEEHGEPFKEWFDCVGLHHFDVEDFEDQYQGEYRTLADYAEQFCDDTGILSECPDNLKMYIDFESMSRDWELGGDIWTIEGGKGVYVFQSR